MLVNTQKPEAVRIGLRISDVTIALLIIKYSNNYHISRHFLRFYENTYLLCNKKFNPQNTFFLCRLLLLSYDIWYNNSISV